MYITIATLFIVPDAFARSSEEMDVLRMFYKEKELFSSATRSLKSVSQVAENITIITSEEIEEMNYHTLAEVLNHVPGLQIDFRTPWSASVMIQGNSFEHSVVKIDGVTLNYLSTKTADIGSIPVQNIESIEIIKGPASSAWGSSLGGIINIVTKSAGNSTNGTVSASYGEKSTEDYRAEASGRAGNIGYYIYAGNIHSDGFRPNSDIYENNLYTKFKLNISNNTDILFSFGYNEGSTGQGEIEIFGMKRIDTDEFERYFSTLTLNHSLTDEAKVSLSLRISKKDLERTIINSILPDSKTPAEDKERGGSIKLEWRKDIHNIVIGADYDRGEEKQSSNSTVLIDEYIENWAIYANDTISINSLSFTPGIRYDHTNIGGDFVSPSMGTTYKLNENTLFRVYIARGFNTPTLAETHLIGDSRTNPDLDKEKVWSYQAGLETTLLDHIWLKASIFRHDIRDAIDRDSVTGKYVNRKKQRRQGFEIEARTAPIHNISFSGGFAYVDAENRTSGDEIDGYGEHTINLGINYDDNKSLRAALKGHLIRWIPLSYAESEHNAFIFDANLIKKICDKDDISAEAFVTVHNIFNSSQYLLEFYENPGRWAEAGIRVKF